MSAIFCPAVNAPMLTFDSQRCRAATFMLRSCEQCWKEIVTIARTGIEPQTFSTDRSPSDIEDVVTIRSNLRELWTETYPVIKPRVWKKESICVNQCERRFHASRVCCVSIFAVDMSFGKWRLQRWSCWNWLKRFDVFERDAVIFLSTVFLMYRLGSYLIHELKH